MKLCSFTNLLRPLVHSTQPSYYYNNRPPLINLQSVAHIVKIKLQLVKLEAEKGRIFTTSKESGPRKNIIITKSSLSASTKNVWLHF